MGNTYYHTLLQNVHFLRSFYGRHAYYRSVRYQEKYIYYEIFPPKVKLSIKNDTVNHISVDRYVNLFF